MILNPGSVGQPRDYDWRASYIIIDGDTAIFKRVEYNYKLAMQKIFSANLPSVSAYRLRPINELRIN
jgi:diadenosine tetraphosphatase ApaH/serine/threonine PP2A family protein phosphatase